MSTITRITTWSTGQSLSSSALNGEFNNIVNAWNNIDSGSTPWTNLSVTTLTVTNNIAGKIVTNNVVGSTTNDSATTGAIGERIVSNTSAYQNFGTTSTWISLISVPLTAGDWDVTGQLDFKNNGATFTGQCAIALSAFSGNTTTDHVIGDNVLNTLPPTSVSDASAVIAAWRVSIASTTTIYCKGLALYSAGTPQLLGRISARRAR